MWYYDTCLSVRFGRFGLMRVQETKRGKPRYGMDIENKIMNVVKTF
jgi:hypothetical protein